MIAHTLPSIVISTTGGTGGYVARAIGQQGLFAMGICLLLLAISVVAWTIIGRKIYLFYRAQTQNEKFLDAFKQLGGDFGSILDRAERCPDSPAAEIFKEGYEELRQTARISGDQLVMSKEALDLVNAKSERSISESVEKLENHLVYLAIATGICPFLGLLGTVWGLLGSFGAMGAAGNPSIAVVGSGIAEALVTTFFGLAAAIPCSLFYNYFQGQAGRMACEMERFTSEFHSRLARNALYHQAKASDRPTLATNRVRTKKDEALVGAGR